MSSYKDTFIIEDLTPLKTTLLNYIKRDYCNRFVLIHTINKRIRMKKSAQYAEVELNNNEKDERAHWI